MCCPSKLLNKIKSALHVLQGHPVVSRQPRRLRLSKLTQRPPKDDSERCNTPHIGIIKHQKTSWNHQNEVCLPVSPSQVKLYLPWNASQQYKQSKFLPFSRKEKQKIAFNGRKSMRA